jgi:hypothetical protein
MALREALELDLEWHRENGPKRLSLIALNGGRNCFVLQGPSRAGGVALDGGVDGLVRLVRQVSAFRLGA